jgi:hypothetical protein
MRKITSVQQHRDKSRIVLVSPNMKQEVATTAIAQALSRALQSAGESDILKQIVLFCGAGLLVSLVCLTYGLDLSPGFF